MSNDPSVVNIEYSKNAISSCKQLESNKPGKLKAFRDICFSVDRNNNILEVMMGHIVAKYSAFC